MTTVIEQMVSLISEGYTPKSVWESTMSLHIGSTAKVNKATTGEDPASGSSITIPENTLVTIIGVGAGPTGADHHVQLPDGRQAVVPFGDLGESALEKKGDDQLDENVGEELTGAVAKIVLDKPLPQGVMDWLEGGFTDYGVELPQLPISDTAKDVTFLMKAEDQDMLDSAIESLRKEAGASFKSSAPASLTDWASA